MSYGPYCIVAVKTGNTTPEGIAETYAKIVMPSIVETLLGSPDKWGGIAIDFVVATDLAGGKVIEEWADRWQHAAEDGFWLVWLRQDHPSLLEAQLMECRRYQLNQAGFNEAMYKFGKGLATAETVKLLYQDVTGNK